MVQSTVSLCDVDVTIGSSRMQVARLISCSLTYLQVCLTLRRLRVGVRSSTAGMAESAQPAIKNMAIVKNKNNVTEMTLAKQIEEYKREQSMVLLSIDQDRLDMKDFLRQIRICESDDLPEARQ